MISYSYCLFIKEIYTFWQNLSKPDYRPDYKEELDSVSLSMRFSYTNYMEEMRPHPESIPTLPNEDHADE